MMSMPPNPLLEDQLADPLWERFLHSSTSDLARASRPDCSRRRADASTMGGRRLGPLGGRAPRYFRLGQAGSPIRPRRLSARWVRRAAGHHASVRH